MKPIIGITIGDPAGVGPEVIIKALSSFKAFDDWTPLLIGDASVFADTIKRLKSDLNIIRVQDSKKVVFKKGSITVFDFAELDSNGFAFGIPHCGCGEISYQAVVEAVKLGMDRTIDAIVTAPICKESWHMAGHRFDGHTGLLAHLTKTKDYRMMFSSEKLNVILVTTHLPLKEACAQISIDKIVKSIKLGHEQLKRQGISSPKIAVCGLNPHAGESGIFGQEEIEIIAPAIQMVKEKGVNVKGPFPSDTIFLQALNKQYDLVVAQYHDQGLIPIKLVAFDTAVNITVGLPVIRTSVDHGTAFDIAGKGIANHENMVCALKYAWRMQYSRKK